MAMALIICIARRLKLVGRLGSFFLKKYISTNVENKKESRLLSGLFLQYVLQYAYIHYCYCCLNSTRRF